MLHIRRENGVYKIANSRDVEIHLTDGEARVLSEVLPKYVEANRTADALEAKLRILTGPD